MPADDDVVEERPLRRLGDDDLGGGGRRRGRSARVVDVARRPRADHPGRELRVTGVGEQVIGAVEGDEALGVARRLEDPGRVLDADRVVDR